MGFKKTHRKGSKRPEEEFNVELWQPRTSIGRKVKAGEITDLSQILHAGQRPREPEIIDALVSGLKEEVLGVNMVQRMHRSGRRVKFRVTTVVGNQDGVVGVANASGTAVGPAIRKAIASAKLNIVEVARGCGSWECMCGRPHSIPFKVSGNTGGAYVTLLPAPHGLGLAASEVPKVILQQAGIKDAWTHARGQTRTTVNFALAVFKALKQTTRMAVSESHAERMLIGTAGEEAG